MAFPVPTHLPRKKDKDDVSTQLLSKMSETPYKELKYGIASGWAGELDVAILQTKERIHERVQQDLPAFTRQLASAKSVQERLGSLQTNVDNLSDALSNPQTGLVHTLIASLSRHAALAQEAQDAQVKFEALQNLARCKGEMRELAQLVAAGMLPEAVKSCEGMQRILDSLPLSVQGSEFAQSLKRRFRAVKDRTDEQLNDAYSRSIAVSASEFIIRPSIQVRQSENVVDFPKIISSLSSTSLSTLLTTLRRDITAHYIDHLLTQPTSLSASSLNPLAGVVEHKLTTYPSPPGSERLITRIENLRKAFGFMKQHLFPSLPESAAFPLSLSQPLQSALLNKLLVPNLPISAQGLPTFLELARETVKLENEVIRDVLGDTNGEEVVRRWVEGLAGHYERRRRVELLGRARELVLGEDGETFRAEAIDLSPEETYITNGKTEAPSASSTPPPAPPVEEVAWGFDDDDETSEDTGGETSDAETAPEPVDEDGWGLDDDVESEPEPIPEPEPTPMPKVESKSSPLEGDPGDAWGWNDGEDAGVGEDGADGDGSTDSSAWDDPWSDSPDPEPEVGAPKKAPRVATKLERLSHKGKNASSSNVSSAVASPALVAPPPPTPAMPALISQNTATVPQPTLQKEYYLVSGRAKSLFHLIESVLQEAIDLESSGILTHYVSASPSHIGDILRQTCGSILDLYRGLYPVALLSTKRSSKGKEKDQRPIIFSNDCLWLSGEIGTMLSQLESKKVPSATREQMSECQERLRVLGECWFENAIDKECQRVDAILDSAEGFVRTEEQERFDECEMAVNEVLRAIKQLSQQFKPVLPKTKYFTALGSLANASLSRVLSDVLALPDITADESHKLSELCRILNALEGLFVDGPENVSMVVAYVPLWLKFSYLSELLEASMADVKYLFDEGALVDFEVEELATLVRALFADTPLRLDTIHKIMQGHPNPNAR